MPIANENPVPKTLNFKGASEFTGVAMSTLKRRHASGQLPGYTFGEGGREIRFFIEDLMALFVEVEVETKSDDDASQQPRSAITAEARAAIRAKRRCATRENSDG